MSFANGNSHVLTCESKWMLATVRSTGSITHSSRPCCWRSGPQFSLSSSRFTQRDIGSVNPWLSTASTWRWRSNAKDLSKWNVHILWQVYRESKLYLWVIFYLINLLDVYPLIFKKKRDLSAQRATVNIYTAVSCINPKTADSCTITSEPSTFYSPLFLRGTQSGHWAPCDSLQWLPAL